MTNVETRKVVGGVDTHKATHHGAVLDAGTGQLIAEQEFPADAAGYEAMLTWMARQGQVIRIGVEGTGSYGAGLARHLAAHRVETIEVVRPNRQQRRLRGKSDPLDAVNAARGACQLVCVSGTVRGGG